MFSIFKYYKRFEILPLQLQGSIRFVKCIQIAPTLPLQAENDPEVSEPEVRSLANLKTAQYGHDCII